MKKFFIFLFFVSVLNAKVATEEEAIKYGKAQSIVVNLHNISYEEKLDLCKSIFNNSGTLVFDNRKEILPIAIKSCQDNIKK
ncbi:hypothetical protein AAX26_01799 [Aliarcobacter thereius]|uniref:Uncharacterized protein n=1 Tax=Aliarcobacter skirrowii TaxID=28200 RepID=A0AAW9DA34_9BACT|nr:MULTISPECIES: hypothetical protein [Aliarcobacter]MDX4069133.1 hypothetical protein [Aliarcobacter skirrowii]OCL85732.1 hypothetical protein AAX26_01799 [Aliarcobacter thereius]OCL86094.1 hypothetical protein AAX27_02113 [Aliarcobacter thereius]